MNAGRGHTSPTADRPKAGWLRRALEAQHGQTPVSSDVLDLEATAPEVAELPASSPEEGLVLRALPEALMRALGVEPAGIEA